MFFPSHGWTSTINSSTKKNENIPFGSIEKKGNGATPMTKKGNGFTPATTRNQYLCASVKKVGTFSLVLKSKQMTSHFWQRNSPNNIVEDEVRPEDAVGVRQGFGVPELAGVAVKDEVRPGGL
ncbi:hypothetical protein J5N97_026176 [Dioscorea zingiberensis]|uniref:Uncharacterized protein n=1 Tax=Dioscorea zingiberensis TaxID=325984 RepID=A0A9D5C2V8_9LILI|nr:hypothetical protein J5N97_026176 [Dioscorea zingiberensis]